MYVYIYIYMTCGAHHIPAIASLNRGDIHWIVISTSFSSLVPANNLIGRDWSTIFKVQSVSSEDVGTCQASTKSSLGFSIDMVSWELSSIKGTTIKRH